MSHFDRNLPKAVETRPKTSKPMKNLPSIFVPIRTQLVSIIIQPIINININLPSLVRQVARKLGQDSLKGNNGGNNKY